MVTEVCSFRLCSADMLTESSLDVRVKNNNDTPSSLGILFLAGLLLQMLASLALGLEINEK